MSLIKEYNKLIEKGFSQRKACKRLGIARSTMQDRLKREAAWEAELREGSSGNGPRILILDVETAPVLGNVWQLFQQNVALNQIQRDSYLLSFAAKWLGEDEVFYYDKRDSWDTEDDSELLEPLWHLMDEADIVLGQNSIRFDEKRINARFIINGFPPPSSYRSIDTLQMAKRHFGFTSNKLEYMTEKLCKKYKKLKHKNYPGFELWSGMLRGELAAFEACQEYNIYDILSTEELYTILRPWYKAHPNVNVYYDDNATRCKCGSLDWEHDGYTHTNLAKYDRFRCQDCGAEIRGSVNLLPKEKRATLGRNV